MEAEGFVRYDSFVGSAPQNYIDKKAPTCPLCGSTDPCWALKQKEGAEPKRIMFRCKDCEGVISVDESEVLGGNENALVLIEDNGKPAKSDPEPEEAASFEEGDIATESDIIFSSSGGGHKGEVCPKCGNVLDSGGRFCDKCGTNIDMYELPDEPHAVHHFQQNVSSGAMQPGEQKHPETNAAYCSKCGKPLSTVGESCSNCGAKPSSFVIPKKSPVTEPVLTQEEKVKFPVAAFVFFLIFAFSNVISSGYTICTNVSNYIRFPQHISMSTGFSAYFLPLIPVLSGLLAAIWMFIGFLLYKKKATYLFGVGFGLRIIGQLPIIVNILMSLLFTEKTPQFFGHATLVYDVGNFIINIIICLGYLLTTVGFFAARSRASVWLKLLGSILLILSPIVSQILFVWLLYSYRILPLPEALLSNVGNFILSMLTINIPLALCVTLYNPHKKK